MDMKNILNDLISQDIISPLIVVMPNSKNDYHGSMYTNSMVTGNWEDFIVDDMVNYVDRNFRTLPQRESRGIAGHSMGGVRYLQAGHEKSTSISCSLWFIFGHDGI